MGVYIENTKLIENEQAYPVYTFHIRWVQDGEHREDYGGNHKGLRKGRIWNHLVTQDKMYKEKLTEKELLKVARTVFNNNVKKEVNPSQPKIKIKLLHYETWCLKWFQHYTFDTGQTNEEALISFEKFVSRMERKNVENGHREHDVVSGNNNPYYCLMGAEDRYRWSGDDAEGNAGADPPCRCKHCKKRGVLTINH